MYENTMEITDSLILLRAIAKSNLKNLVLKIPNSPHANWNHSNNILFSVKARYGNLSRVWISIDRFEICHEIDCLLKTFSSSLPLKEHKLIYLIKKFGRFVKL